MLSICIPVYNRDCTVLVNELRRQAVLYNLEVEVVVIDDASEKEYKLLNQSLRESNRVVYVELERNIGRSAIRNLLVEKAKYDYLLFLDCDVIPFSKEFILNYSSYIASKTQVIIGGRQYREEDDTPQTKLHYRYGCLREAKSAQVRNQNPYDAFVTGNFCIQKALFREIRFDDTLVEYGHEDTLFGIALKKNNVQVLHIDNPVLHIGVECNEVFLDKQLKAVYNLVYLIGRNHELSSISLYAFYLKLERLKVLGLVLFIMKPFSSLLKKALARGYTNALVVFDLVRLIEFSDRMKRVKRN